MAKATKNNGTFETLNTRKGTRYSATRGNIEIIVTPERATDRRDPMQAFYVATINECGETRFSDRSGGDWDDALAAVFYQMEENDVAESFFSDCMTLAKDLIAFVKRPARETYNSRR